jgi:hypothetical protein
MVAISWIFVLLSMCKGFTMGIDRRYTTASVVTPVMALPR